MNHAFEYEVRFIKFDNKSNALGRFVGLVVVTATADQEVLGSIPGSDRVLLGFFHQYFFSNSRGVCYTIRYTSA